MSNYSNYTKSNILLLNPYLEKLKEADALHYAAERTKPNLRPSLKTLWNVANHNRHLSRRELKRRKAEIAYEKALEILEELFSDYPSFCNFLDRPVSFHHEHCNVSPDAHGVPRLFNSRSHFAIKGQRQF